METGTSVFYGAALLTAVQNGAIPESLLDRSVLRILRTVFKVGIFDNGYAPTAIPVQKDGALAGAIQDKAITLLQNTDSVLTLSSGVRSVAVIGAYANVTSRVGGSFAVQPTYEVPVLDGIRERAATIGATVSYAPGNDPVNAASMIETADMTAIPSSVLTPESGSGTGLTARHYADTAFGGTPVTRVEGQVVYDTGFTSGAPAFANLYASQVPVVPVVGGNPILANQSVTYSGFLTAPTTGSYRLGVTGWGDARVYLGNDLIVDMTGQAGRRAVDTTVQLTGGQRYGIGSSTRRISRWTLWSQAHSFSNGHPRPRPCRRPFSRPLRPRTPPTWRSSTCGPTSRSSATASPSSCPRARMPSSLP
jgi:beta-glucosidase